MVCEKKKKSLSHAIAVTAAYFLCKISQSACVRELAIVAQWARHHRHWSGAGVRVPAVGGAAYVQVGNAARPNPAMISFPACLPSP